MLGEGNSRLQTTYQQAFTLDDGVFVIYVYGRTFDAVGPVVMRVTHFSIKNWRNFKQAEFDLQERMFIVGPNAAGKSNLIDALRFLRQIAVPGGGFQDAVASRGGMRSVRCLSAKKFNHGHITIRIVIGVDDELDRWTYELTFGNERGGQHRPILKNELVMKKNKLLLSRPSRKDRDDQERMTQTALEQVSENREFRDIVDFFLSIRYLHLVPQFFRQPRQNNMFSDDPYGANLACIMGNTHKKVREKRLSIINRALKVAVPQFDQLNLAQDETGTWHLEAKYEHWHSSRDVQNEKYFSDGTLRLIGLLWVLLERKKIGGVVLLEEPELSLHPEIVRQLPVILYRVGYRNKVQFILSTHSNELLSNPGLGSNEVLILKSGAEGTKAELASSDPSIGELLDIGFEFSEFLPKSTISDTVVDLPFRVAP